MTAIRVYDELGEHDRWPGMADPIDPATQPAAVAPDETVRLALERLEVARTADVRVDDPWAEAGRKVIRFHLVRMLGHVPGVIAGADPEDVHAMRVAGRRIRAAWRVFGDGFDVDAKRRYRRDLRVIGAHLGAVRDLDVMLEILDAHGENRPARQRVGLEPLRAAWTVERDGRHAALVDLLRSTMFQRFVAGYTVLATESGRDARPIAMHEPASVRTRMPSTIWDAYQAVWAFDGDLSAADMVSLHQLRISAKWLRYTLEFVREPLEPESTMLLRRVVALQDRLGDIHDIHGAATLARGFVEAGIGLGRAERSATTRLERQLDARTARLQRELGPTWRRLSGSSYRRGLGQAIARF
jgi:CHAD domain-containing protein